NQAEYRQKSGKPFTREAVRYMLQNRTYLGLIGYKPCVKNPDGSRKKNVPITWDELAQAAKILSNFKQAWEEAEGNLRKKLLRLVAEKVFVQGDYVTAVTLRPSYHVLVAQR
ncbi:MAG: recombinase family protein, partial [Anaerolineae bacterium]